MSQSAESIQVSAPQCRRIVRRAYRELRKSGLADQDAFESATKVLRHHHPELPDREARFRVAEWLG